MSHTPVPRSAASRSPAGKAAPKASRTPACKAPPRAPVAADPEKPAAFPAAPPAAPASDPATTRHDGWSPDVQAAFLRALSATHSVSEAARSVGRTRQSAYRLRSRLKGKPFDLAWEVAFRHSYDVLAHTALDRALNGVEVPVYYKGEMVGSWRRFDERLTVALLGRYTLGGNPTFGRNGPVVERHARDFETLLAKLEQGEDVATGALTPDDPGELEGVISGPKTAMRAPPHCPSAWSDDELMASLQGHKRAKQK